MADNLPTKILIVDDDPTFIAGLEQALQKYRITVVKAVELDGALYLFNQNKFDVVLVEIDFAPLAGLALVQKWRNHEALDKRCTGFVMVASGSRNNGHDSLIREMGDLELVSKPTNPAQLLGVLAKALVNKQRMLSFFEMRQRIVDPYLKTGNVQKAIDRVQELVADVGDRGRKLLVEMYENASQWQECLDMSLDLLKQDNNNISLINTAGRMYMRLGKFDDAKPFLEKADALAPSNLERMNTMATMYLQMHEPEKSVAVFKELVKLNPEAPDYKFEVFQRLYDAGYDEHAVGFGKEVAKPMEIVRHYNNKGVILAKDVKHQEALLEYERALKFFPKFKENYRIYYNMALAHISFKTSEDYAKANEYLKRALELNPEFEKAKTTLANLQKILNKAS